MNDYCASEHNGTHPDMLAPERNHPPFKVLGVPVDAVQVPDVILRIERWIQKRDQCRCVMGAGMHGLTGAQHDPAYKQVLNSADLVFPDGMPLVWLGRLRGEKLRRRVYGPELMERFCEQTASKGYRHFFYGGAPGVPERVADRLSRRFPGLVVVGICSPPFRRLTPEEDEGIVAAINRAAPDVLWVGLGNPKQEFWMHSHRHRLRVPVLVGVGAAFDFHAGVKRQAPRWMREHGFEWLFRLLQEPRRLWRRYLVYGPQFVYYVCREALAARRSAGEEQQTGE